MAGGTFFSNESNDTSVSSRATGSFLILSALLAEATSNQTYLDAAIESATFIQSHLLSPSDIVLNYISSSCAVNQDPFSYNCGIFIEGLVILGDITHNASTTLLRGTIVAVTSTLDWHGSDGILKTKTNGGHHVVRALAALYERNTTSSDLREYIKQYIGVQYNAVIKQATSGSNIYGIPWTKLSSNTFNSDSQTVAMSALLSSMQLVDGSSDNPTSSAIPSPSPSTSPLPIKKTRTGAMVGGVVGGVAVLAVIIAGVFLLRRRHHRRNNNPLVVDERSPWILTPFMTTSNPVSSEVSGQHAKMNQAKYAVVTSRESSSSSSGLEQNAMGSRMDVRIGSTASPGAVASLPNPLHTEGRDVMPTEELLRLLNERLQLGGRNDLNDDLPPEIDHEERTM
ncbi:hypothetical protein ARMSODRAFT_1090065 [Armillaria solidipes]|uniref:Glycoside hydrolase family 76 protein n=1 Tax=Armillaria solidipes TaxID=1076256 RepID=A0A2H3B1F8_9AGAR|nr:hypothetical protein ARMSODRAFT_1090065 [Armillaria solidipes]